MPTPDCDAHLFFLTYHREFSNSRVLKVLKVRQLQRRKFDVGTWMSFHGDFGCRLGCELDYDLGCGLGCRFFQRLWLGVGRNFIFEFYNYFVQNWLFDWRFNYLRATTRTRIAFTQPCFNAFQTKHMTTACSGCLIK